MIGVAVYSVQSGYVRNAVYFCVGGSVRNEARAKNAELEVPFLRRAEAGDAFGVTEHRQQKRRHRATLRDSDDAVVLTLRELGRPSLYDVVPPRVAAGGVELETLAQEPPGPRGGGKGGRRHWGAVHVVQDSYAFECIAELPRIM